MNKIKILLLAILIVNCMGPSKTIRLDGNNNLGEFTYVEWATTKSDSIIDFRNSKDGFARIENNLIIENIGDDSTRVYNLVEFKTIYANDGDDSLTYTIIGGTIIIGFFIIITFVPFGGVG
jgi:hypothetical protein